MWFHAETDRGAYIAVVDGGRGFGVQREPGPFIADRYIEQSDGEAWEKFSLAYFDGTIEVWYKDELHIGVTDEEPYEDGFQTIALSQSTGSTYFDNIVICKLSEPYTPPVVEEDVD